MRPTRHPPPPTTYHSAQFIRFASRKYSYAGAGAGDNGCIKLPRHDAARRCTTRRHVRRSQRERKGTVLHVSSPPPPLDINDDLTLDLKRWQKWTRIASQVEAPAERTVGQWTDTEGKRADAALNPGVRSLFDRSFFLLFFMI